MLSPNISAPAIAVEVLDAREDEYDGIVIDPRGLPSSINAFASALKASLCHWRLMVKNHSHNTQLNPPPQFHSISNCYCLFGEQGKRGVWLKLLEEQAELVPITIGVRIPN